MDAETLKSLGWLLLWGGLFFLMMRYGCGAHMTGRHGHGSHGHGGHGSGGDSDFRDPVCGMTVTAHGAAAASVRAGHTYYFCSVSCRDKFEQTPDKYLAAPAQEEQPHGGHHHG